MKKILMAVLVCGALALVALVLTGVVDPEVVMACSRPGRC